MPTWKKVIVSGSSPTLNELTLSGDANLAPTSKLNFDGDGGHTYIRETAADQMDFYVGNELMLRLDEGNNVIHIPQDAAGGVFQIGVGGDLQLYIDSDDAIIRNQTSNKDIKFIGKDGSANVTALALDMSEAGNAQFNANISGSQIEASGDVIAFGSSDERLKDNITHIHKPIDKINKIGGYKFTWNNKQDTYLGKDVGVLAQEIEAIMPEVVTTRATGYKAVKYEKIVPLLIEGIKELNKKIEDIEKNCDCLKK